REQGMDAHGTQTLERRIGKPEAVAETAAVEYRKRSLIMRHPLIAFSIAPLPLLILSFVGCMLVTFGVAWCLRPVFEHMPYLTTANVSPRALFAMKAGL